MERRQTTDAPPPAAKMRPCCIACYVGDNRSEEESRHDPSETNIFHNPDCPQLSDPDAVCICPMNVFVCNEHKDQAPWAGKTVPMIRPS